MPIASTSSAWHDIKSESKPEIDVRTHQHETDPIAVTHGDLDPARDGVFARMENQPHQQQHEIEVAGVTHGDLDPTRDGVFARMKDQQQQQQHQEIDLQQPLIESEPNHVRLSEVRLPDSMGVTHGELDPTRDGVFARIRNRALQHGSTAVVGSVFGAAAGGLATGGLATVGLEAKRLFNQNNNTAQPVNQTDTVAPVAIQNANITQPMSQKESTPTNNYGIINEME